MTPDAILTSATCNQRYELRLYRLRALVLQISGQWVQQSMNQQPFWVAIDPWGEMRTRIHGARPTYLVSKAKAKVTTLVRRPPEPHPGRTDRPVKVPIKLKRVGGEVFTRWVQTG
jgi:hypothetical protein